MEVSSGRAHETDATITQDIDDTAAESYSRDEMRHRLIELDNPAHDADKTADCVTMEIIDDTVISARGLREILGGSKIFILNVLRLRQGQPCSLADIEALGFPEGRRALYTSITELQELLNRMAETPIIDNERSAEGKGRPSFYTMSPDVRIVDRRQEYVDMPGELLKKTCAERGEDGKLKILEDGSVAFINNARRMRVTSLMFAEYRERAGVEAYLEQFVDRRRAVKTKLRQLTPLSQLAPEKEQELLSKKEEALKVYLSGSGKSGKQALNQQKEEVILEGVRAGYELFAHNLDLVGRLAAIFSRPNSFNFFTPYHELYQEGAQQLMETVLAQPYDKHASYSFRMAAYWRIKKYNGRGMLPLRELYASPVTISQHNRADYQKVKTFMRDYQGRTGHLPDVRTVIEEGPITTLDYKSTEALVGACRGTLSLDFGSREKRDDDWELNLWTKEPDFVDDELDRMEIEDTIDAIFSSSELSDVEKIVLSLQYEVFHPSLCGAEVHSKGTTFIYPYTEEEFNTVLTKFQNLETLSIDLFGRSEGYAYAAHSRGIARARTLLLKDPAFSLEVDDSIEERLEEERKAVVAAALEVSPNKRIGSTLLRVLRKTGDFPYRESYICELFGTLMNFHKRCGFEPDKGQVARGMSPEDIVNFALEIRPDASLNTNEVKVLSRRGLFVSYQSIATNFGGMPAFREACEKEIRARAAA